MNKIADKELLLEPLEIGPMQNFAYFIGDKLTGEVAIVDPGWDTPLICRTAEEKKYTIKAVFLTHGHYDHANGVEELLTTHDVPVYLSEHEATIYTPDCRNLERTVDGQCLKIGNIEFKCLHTPGHTPGCQCFKRGLALITGDTLFVDGCGRCDLPGGDAKQMYNTLYNILLKLPDETIIYPGHAYGRATSDALGTQKKTNPYLQCSSLQAFLVDRMGIVC